MDNSRKLVICATMAALLLGAAVRAKENPDISLKAAQTCENHINRDSPDEPQTKVDFCVLAAF
jgi:hypothetical protein